jgi:hypothetical protein
VHANEFMFKYEGTAGLKCWGGAHVGAQKVALHVFGSKVESLALETGLCRGSYDEDSSVGGAYQACS